MSRRSSSQIRFMSVGQMASSRLSASPPSLSGIYKRRRDSPGWPRLSRCRVSFETHADVVVVQSTTVCLPLVVRCSRAARRG